MSDAASPAARPMFSGYTVTRSAGQRFTLQGPDSPDLDTLLCTLVLAGVHVLCKAPRSRYVLVAPIELLDRMAELVAAEPGAKEAGFVLEREVEPPITEAPTLRSEPVRSAPWRRVTEVQGAFSHVAGFVARAIDYGLTTRFEGAGRYSVTGPTARQVAWVSSIRKKPRAQTMTDLAITEAMAAREDRDGVPMAVNAAPRRTVVTANRDRSGEIAGTISEASDED
jgi:hypothetical protein